MYSSIIYCTSEFLNIFEMGIYMNGVGKKQRVSRKTLEVTMTGLFAAIIFIFTMFIKIPMGPGYIHVGDGIVYLFASMVFGPWAAIAGAIGEGLADIVGGYAIYAIPTAIIKPLMALPVIYTAKNKEKMFCFSVFISTIGAGLIGNAGYFIVEYFLFKNYAYLGLLSTFGQGIGSTVTFIIFSLALDRVDIKKRVNDALGLEIGLNK